MSIDLIRTASNETSSASVLRINGQGPTVINGSTATYKVLEGKVTFHTPGKVIILSKNNSITIPAGVPYCDNGKGIMISRCTPPYNKERVQVID